MSKPINIKEQLAYLKGITVMTGGIHDAQALQLKNYPIVIDGVKSAKTTVDSERKIVNYDLKLKKGASFGDAERKVADAIVLWVRTIIWDETSVIFKVGKEVVYDSRNR
jgi:hypothetical protein